MPRLLVTGFGVFPGAPVNPTEKLVRALREAPPPLDGVGALIRAARRRLRDDLRPPLGNRPVLLARHRDHFGLARECSGFRLERTARNSHRDARPDNSGALPVSRRVCDGGNYPSSLPLDDIHAALRRAGLPVEWSDDAGGYLASTVFTLSRAPCLRRPCALNVGFVHVPPLREAEPKNPRTLAFDDLMRGALIIIDLCVARLAATRA
ncbi:MAG: hypothetical protein M9905_17030 [Rhizobiaceae bacterium]|nr:hypothetical protein [Rhizobiaceae bacterium]